jgi:hypothetical protein
MRASPGPRPGGPGTEPGRALLPRLDAAGGWRRHYHPSPWQTASGRYCPPVPSLQVPQAPVDGQELHSRPQGDRKARAIDYGRQGNWSRPVGASGGQVPPRESRETLLISLYQSLASGRSRLPVLGSIVLATALAAGCSASSAAPAPASSSSAGPGSNAAFRQCLQRQGVSLPQGRPPQGSGQPHARPTGSAASAFRKALQACGGGSFPRGGNGAG